MECNMAPTTAETTKEEAQRDASTSFFRLTNRSVIAIVGDDAIKFINRLTTNDIEKVAENQLCYTWLLTPTGKCEYDFFVEKVDDRMLRLDVSTLQKESIIAKLKFFKMRYKLEIIDLSSMMSVVASFAHETVANHSFMTSPDPRSQEMGYRAMVSNEKLQSVKYANNLEYERRRISLCIPDSDLDMIDNRSFPLEYGIDQLHGIDFDKGCYPGQEAIASVYYKGEVRKKLYQLKLHEIDEEVEKGTSIIMNGHRIGMLLGQVGSTALALLKVESVEEYRTSYQKVYIASEGEVLHSIDICL